MYKKIITTITLTAFVFVTLFSPFPGPTGKANAQGTGSLRLVTNTAGFSFKMDLMQGDTDNAVKELQKVLNSSSDTMVAPSGAGSPGSKQV